MKASEQQQAEAAQFRYADDTELGQRERVRAAIPFGCKVALPRQERDAKVVGSGLDFPHVVHDADGVPMDVEISWDLAYRLLIGITHCVRL